MSIYSNSRIMRRCGQLGLPYAEAVARRYFAEQGLVAPDLLAQHSEGVEGFTGNSERKRPIDSLKTLPHNLSALQNLLQSSPVERVSAVPPNTYLPSAWAQLTAAEASTPVKREPLNSLAVGATGDQGEPTEILDDRIELNGPLDVDIDSSIFVPIFDDRAFDQSPIESFAPQREAWTTESGEGFDVSGETWGQDLTNVVQIDGDGVICARTTKRRGSNNDHLVRGLKGRKAKRRTIKTSGTRVVVASSICHAWCNSVCDKGYYSSEDVDELIAECKGNTKYIDLRSNIIRALESSGFEERDAAAVAELFWDARAIVDAEELYIAIDVLLNRSTDLPGTTRFTMNRIIEEGVLQQLLAARQTLAQAILMHDTAILDVINLRHRGYADVDGALLVLNNWIDAGRVTHGKAWRGALAAVEQLGLDEFELQRVMSDLGFRLPAHPFNHKLSAALADRLAITEHLRVMYLPIVRRMAARSTRYGEDLEDVFQAASIGLLRATDLVNVKSAVHFRGYLAIWVNQSIMQWRAAHGRAIPIPLNRQQTIERFERGEREIEPNSLGFPDPNRLSHHLGWTAEQVETYSGFLRSPASLNAIKSKEQSSCWGAPEQNYLKRERDETIELILGTIAPRQAKILTLYFGLDSLERHTLEEIGSLLGLTRERIRQIRDRAIELLQHGPKAKALVDFHLDWEA